MVNTTHTVAFPLRKEEEGEKSVYNYGHEVLFRWKSVIILFARCDDQGAGSRANPCWSMQAWPRVTDSEI